MKVQWSGYWNECVSELTGAFLLVLIGSGSVVAESLIGFPSAVEGLVFVAFVFGATVASMILLIGKRSGAHINPAISIASVLTGLFRRRLLVPYVVFQVAGGLLAGLTLKLLFGSLAPAADLGSTKLAAGVTPL